MSVCKANQPVSSEAARLPVATARLKSRKGVLTLAITLVIVAIAILLAFWKNDTVASIVFIGFFFVFLWAVGKLARMRRCCDPEEE
jgi:hypothetical protein